MKPVGHRRPDTDPTRWSRRQFFGASTLATVAAWLGGPARAAQSGGRSPTSADLEAKYRDNIYTRLAGVRPHLPAHEHVSRLGGGRIAPEVVRAMAEANEFFVDMHELTEAAGRRVAQTLGAEAAVIASGAFSAMVLGAAACLTGTDGKKIEALPHPAWEPRECLMQKAHRFSYDRAFRNAGMTIVEVETRDQFKNAVSNRTAMIAVLGAIGQRGHWSPPIPRRRLTPLAPEVMKTEEFLEIGKRAGVPVLIDTASDVPPKDNLTRYFKMGADLVVLSGGKGLRGPQSTGILAGRRDLIEAAILNASPYDNIGRGMKVGKEEIIGVLAALERYMNLDESAMMAAWARKAEYIARELRGIPGFTAEAVENTGGYVDVEIGWDPKVIPLTQEQARTKLMEGQPRLTYDGTTVRTRNLLDGEEVLVAERLRAFFLEEGRKGA
jgi:L-seryl-tRNA(Ser) seleniumtransferase